MGSHDFEKMDLDESAYRKSMETQIGNEDDDLDLKLIEGMSAEQRKELDELKVNNPFNLKRDDPLLLSAKLRKWKNRQKLACNLHPFNIKLRSTMFFITI